MANLVVKSGSLAGREFPITHDMVIGRGNVDIVLDMPTISRQHAMLMVAGNQFLVSDLNSANGTFLNGARISEAAILNDGDQVQFGDVMCQFVGSTARAQAAAPEHEAEAAPILQRVDADDPLSSLFAEAPLETLRRRLEIVHDVATALSQSVGEEATLSLVVDRLFDLFPQAERAFVMLSDEHTGGELTPRIARTRTGNPSPIAVSRSMIRDVIETREAILTVDATQDSRFALRQTIQSLRLRTVLCVPLIANDQVFGVMQLDGSNAMHPFSKDDMSVLVGIAAQLALSLANVRLHTRLLNQQLLQQDLMLAKRIQAHFLPRHAPSISGYEFEATYVPAQDVGGDFYDYIDLRDGHFAIAAGDASGKGVPAALYMAKLTSDLRYHSAGVHDPGQILQRINHAFAADVAEGMFATIIVAVLHPHTHQLRLGSAGHLPVFVRRGETVIHLPTPPNVPIGVNPNHVFESSAHQLQPGDSVVLYTDGISEALSGDHQLFGEERLTRHISDAPSRPKDILSSVLSGVQKFAHGQPQSDDITLVVFGPR